MSNEMSESEKKPTTQPGEKVLHPPQLEGTYEFAGEGTEIPPNAHPTPTPVADAMPLNEQTNLETKLPVSPPVTPEPAAGSMTEQLDMTVEMTVDLTGHKTVAEEAIEKIVEPTPTVEMTLAFSGHKTMPEQTMEFQAGGAEKTAANLGATVDVHSILSKPNIGMTINPRDLSPQEQEEWDTSVGRKEKSGSHGERQAAIAPIFPTQLDRQGITESRLQVPPRYVAGLNNNLGLVSDYEIIEVLGEGGMGTVYLAKQSSLDRFVALKVVRNLEGEQAKKLAATGKLDQAAKNRRDQFLSEAIVTGDLDHPNIVPIHDLAVMGETLFYAMKKVDGKPWSKVIRQNSQDENIEILLKVCDGVGFAHSRGIVHRDIKPENIMLGDFGVVLVMDWGLAVPKAEYPKRNSIYQSTSLGGSPAYMAPEMAIGPVEKIGPASDIYLLGATLFQIIVGRPPHGGNNVSECLRAVTTNTFVDVPPEHRNELMEIAMKAMATNIKDRYANVGEMQAAIRQYRSHAESISLSVRAEEDLDQGKLNQDYTRFSRAIFGFQEAIKLWSGNKRATEGLATANLAYAETACAKGDYELGLSLLDPQNANHQGTIAELKHGLQERESRQKRLVWMKRTAAALLGVILVGGSGALYQIDKERGIAIKNEVEAVENKNQAEHNLALAVKSQRETEEQRAIAEMKKEEAIRNASEAERQRMIADDQRMIAEDQKLLAEKNADEARRERKNAEYEAYIAQIGLAKARVDQNEFDDARRILIDLKSKAAGTLGWEWQWLWHQANQSSASENLGGAATDLSISPSGNTLVVTRDDGEIEIFQRESASAPWHSEKQLSGVFPAMATATSPDGQFLAVASRQGAIQIWEIGQSRLIATLPGHSGLVSAVRFVTADLIVSGSHDRSVRLWNLKTQEQLAEGWHLAAVHDLAVVGSGSEYRVITAVADERMGQGVVWNLNQSETKESASTKSSSWKFTLQAEFLAHKAPVFAVDLAPNGKLAASGDRQGNLYLWEPDSVPTVDYPSAIRQAVLRQKNRIAATPPKPDVPFHVLKSPLEPGPLRLVAFTEPVPPKAHQDAIEGIRFDAEGIMLLSASTDSTVKVWDVSSRELKKSLRGHGGWVRDAEFVPKSKGEIVSVSNDATVRVWHPNTMLEPQTIGIGAHGDRQKLAHGDEIWSAAFDATGTKILTASRDHTARILSFDSVSMSFLPTTELKDDEGVLEEGSKFMALSMAHDPTNKRLFVGSTDAIIRVWNQDTGGQLSEAKGTGLNNCLAIAPNGKFLVTGSSGDDARALVWDVSSEGILSAEPRFRLGVHQGVVTAMAVSSDSRWIFTGDRNGIGVLWDATTGKQSGSSLNQHQGSRINAAQFSSASDLLLIAADDQKLSRMRVSNRELLKSLATEGVVSKISISSDSRFAATISEQARVDGFLHSLTLWNLASGEDTQLEQRFVGAKEPTGTAERPNLPVGKLLAARFMPGSGSLMVSFEQQGQSVVSTWKAVGGIPRRPQSGFRFPSTTTDLVDLIPDGQRGFISLHGDTALLWDLNSQNHLRSYRSHGAVTEASFSANGKYVLTGSRSIKVWDSVSGRALQKLEFPHEGSVRSVQFEPTNGLHFASAGDDGIVRLWEWNPSTHEIVSARDLISPTRERGVIGNDGGIRRIRYSSSGKRLLAVHNDGVARLWDLEDTEGAPLEFRDVRSSSTFTCGAISPDERWIVVGGTDRTARIWKVDRNSTTNTEPQVVLQGHADQIEDVGFLGTDESNFRVMTASRDKSARIFDPRLTDGVRAGREIVALRKHSLGVTSIAATNDARLLLTASRDGTVILWPANSPDPK
jgi:hypothetical protein